MMFRRRSPRPEGGPLCRPATAVPRSLPSCAIVLILAGLVSACKIEKTPVGDPSQTATSVFINDSSFNPDSMVDADWDKKILPIIRDKAGAYADVAAAIAKNPDEAGERFGYREKQAGSVWTYVARFDGVITAANTESRAATATIKTEGAPDVTLQIGPVVRGTAIRDLLAYMPFGAFKNQVDYAQFGKSLNTKANATALVKLPRADLVGRRVKALGAFQAGPGGAPYLVTPVDIALEPKP